MAKSGFVFQGTAFDAHGTKPEQVMQVNIPATESAYAATCQTCVIIPTLMSNDSFTERVVSIFNSPVSDAKPHILPFLKDQKRHYEFRGTNQYTCLSVHIAYDHDYLPREVSVGVIEACKMQGFAFKNTKQGEPHEVRKIRELGQELITREQQIKSRFLGLRGKHGPAHDEALNTILMEHANIGLMHYAQQTGAHFIARHYNVGGGYHFARAQSYPLVTPDADKPILGRDIIIPQEKAHVLFDTPQKNRYAQTKFTKPDRIDCALNLHIAHCYRDNAARVTAKHIDRIVSILNYTPSA